MNELDKALQVVKDNNQDYYNRLHSFAENWVKTTMKPFTAEDLKKAFFADGNEEPEQPNVIGCVIRNLSKENLIHKNSTAYANMKTAHGRLLNKWISTEYRLKQQSNSNSKYKEQTEIIFSL